MDPWKELAAREECRDVARRWAGLEVNNPNTADDVVQQYARRAVNLLDTPLAISAGVRVIAWVVETLWHVTRR